MLEKELIIFAFVTIFGILFFLYVKRALKKQLDHYLSKKNNKNKNRKA